MLSIHQQLLFLICICVTLPTMNVCRLAFRRRKVRERAPLLGCSISTAAHALPFALAQAALGAAGLQCAVLLSIVNSFAGKQRECLQE